MSEEHEENSTDFVSKGEVEADFEGDPIEGLQRIHSLCMRCGGNGITHMMIHKIPYFRELIISSFTCDDCGEFNNEVTFGGEIQLQGCVYTLNLKSCKDLNRQIIKSDSASLKVVELDFEIPAKTQKGEINTIEGFLKTAASNLSLHQVERLIQMPEAGMKVAEIISKLEVLSSCDDDGDFTPCTIILDDPSGNSFIENPHAPSKDPNMSVRFYFRTPEQDEELGLQPNKGLYKDDKESNFQALMKNEFGSGGGSNVVEDHSELGRNEAIGVPSYCPNCAARGEMLTCITNIPHFKEVVIMSFNCAQCGYKSNEVKGGGAIPTFGTEVSVKVTTVDDLKRDVLKSDSSNVSIPELEMELSYGTLGGMYTSVEGLLLKIHKSLYDHDNCMTGDSSVLHHSESNDIAVASSKFSDVLQKLQDMAKGNYLPFTLTLRDPLGNSFISAPLGSFLTPEEDSALTVTDFERSEEENEEFGLNLMNTKDYEVVNEAYVPKGVVHSDRVTEGHRTVIDHPSLYAKGCDDNTAGGRYFGHTESTEVADDRISSDWVASNVREDIVLGTN